MGKFAKLFDIEGEQVLIHTELNEEGNPSVRVVTEINGAEASLRISFNPKTDKEPFDMDKAWEACDRALADIEIDDAIKLRDKLVIGFSEK